MTRCERITYQLLKYGKDVEAVYLYGSTARGEQDELSDLDLLIVSELNPIHLLYRIKEDLGITVENEVEIISNKQLAEMFEAGSDLAWTIYQEAKLLFCQPGHSQITQPGEHIISQDFLASQYQKLESSEVSLARHSKAIGFECIQIYSAIRRVYISLRLQLKLYRSDKAIRALNLFLTFEASYQEPRSFVRQGKAGFRSKLPPIEWVLNLIACSTNWISLVGNEYGLTTSELQKNIVCNERAIKAREHYREVLDFYSKEFYKLPPPFTLSNVAIDAWCKDAYRAGYDESIELYRFSVGDFNFRRHDTLSRVYAILYERGTSKVFNKYINLVLDYK